MKKPHVAIKRAYEDASEKDGYRVLVDRVWPRGVTKEAAALDLWLKEAGPSTELRKWFGHDPARFDAFRARYLAELKKRSIALEPLRRQAAKGRLTLLYGAKDTRHNQAVVLRDLLSASEAESTR